MISSIVSRLSALVLAAGGLAFLFVPDALLGTLVPGLPPSGAWLAQLIGAGWLAVAVLNWLQRGAVLGGIYGRPVVLTNLVLYTVTALTVTRRLMEPATPRTIWFLLVPMALLAIVYGALLLRGPFGSLQDSAR
jgi:hypothetical protein